MKRQNVLFATLLSFLVAIFLLSGCGGSSGRGSFEVNGSLGGGTTGTGGTGRTVEDIIIEDDDGDVDELTVAPQHFSGIEVCCGGQCDVTGASGDFQLFINPVSGDLLCSVNGPQIGDDFFIIMNIPEGANSIKIFVTIENGVVAMTELLSSTTPESPAETESTPEATATAEPEETATAEATAEPTPAVAECGNGVLDAAEFCDGDDLDETTCESLGYSGGGDLACDSSCDFDISGCKMAESCSEPLCPSTSEPPTCLSCSCDDGFPIGDCSAICLDTGLEPTTCTGGVGCPGGDEPSCP